MDGFTLFAANSIVVFVVAAAFWVAGRAKKESFWSSWSLANFVIGLALLAFMYERLLPDLFTVTAPNALLVLGMALKWRAARQFAGRRVSALIIWAPTAVFVALCAWPSIYGSYGAVYTIVNVLLTCLAVASAYEFWRDRDDHLPSRYGLVLAYGVLAVSFAGRVAQGLVAGEEMARHLPHDALLKLHLMIALFHLTTTGAFALSLAYERDAASLRRMAAYDALTGLLNRGAFEARAREYMAGVANRNYAILVLDLDHFKQVNDRFGHAAGDRTLQAAAAAIAEILGTRYPLARWGGEEFAALLTDVSAVDALQLAERVRAAVGSLAVECGGGTIRPTVSAGICHGDAGAASFDELMSMADAGLYMAKDNGRDCVEEIAA